MDFQLTPDQIAYRDTVARFTAEQLGDDVIRRDAEARSREMPGCSCAAFGIQGLPVPEKYGGSGADVLTVALALEELGYGCKDNGLIFALNAQMWAFEVPLARFGTEEQKRRYLPGLCDGSLIAAQAMSEPGSGSDAFSLATRAERRGNAFVLTGSKTFVSNGPEADVFLVYATIDPSQGFAGLCGFLIDRGTPGLTVGPPLHKMGLRTAPMSELFLDGCELAEQSAAREARIGDGDLQPGDALGAQPHPRGRGGNDAPAARALRRVCATAPAVRPTDRQLPGGIASDRRDAG